MGKDTVVIFDDYYENRDDFGCKKLIDSLQTVHKYNIEKFELLSKKLELETKKLEPIYQKLDELDERIKWETGKAKELVSRRPGLNDFLQSRAV